MEIKREKYIGSERKNEKKVSEKHKQLADFIKEIHTQLRNESEMHGAEEAWKMHVKQNEKLKNYAESMYQLATKHWTQQSQSANPLTYCRIEWIKNKCKDYFFNGGMKKFDEKEIYLISKDIESSSTNRKAENIETQIESKLNILDVGSCYNPFNTENLFSVIAIDIAPYSNDVIKCDFLNLKVESTKRFSDDDTLIEMPKNYFDVIIFSLLLEYIPCPNQRFLCCQKAYDLLKDGGILFIATPDSKHEGANTKIINTSWKVILAKLGFMRICYEKLPHIHCLMFRKCFFKEAAVKRINWKKIPNDDELFSSSKIFIPQDFHVKKLEEEIPSLKEFKHNDEDLSAFFGELPHES